jgi:hypothetical protein
MKWGYFVLWGLLAWKELPEVWEKSRWKGVLLWLTIGGLGLGLAVWYFWGNTQWRLAEWLMEQ